MARDEALLVVGREPTLRFFFWDRPTLSLGRYQKKEDLDLAFLERENIPYVRRPTGGRAILHGDEVTFSFFLPKGENLYTHRFLYSVVQEALRKALADVSVYTDPKKAAPSLRSPACFSLTLPHELAVSGKKIAGVAQVRTLSGNLFEGSIPFSLDRLRFALCFRERERVYEELLESAAGLWEIRKDLKKEELIERMVLRFGELFGGVDFGKWSEEELAKTRELLAGKYAPSSLYHLER